MTATTAGPGFREGAPVSLFLEGSKLALDCRVLAFHRDHIVLDRPAGPDLPGLRRDVVTYVVYDSGDRVAALRVRLASVEEHRIVLRLLDRFTLGQRRSFTRLEARWRIGLEGLDEQRAFAPRVDCETLDVSAGGALVARPPALDEFAAFRATLALPDGGEPLVVAAQAIRFDPRAVALRFAGLQPEHEARIAQVILEALAAGARVASPSPERLLAGGSVPGDRQARVDRLVAAALA